MWPWWFFALFVILDFYYAFASWEDIRKSIGWIKHIPQKTDFKIRHIVQFSPQAIWLYWIFFVRQNRSLKVSFILSFLIISLIGALSEAIQILSPTRIPTFQDVFWNVVAALIGSSFSYLYFRYKKAR